MSRARAYPLMDAAIVPARWTSITSGRLKRSHLRRAIRKREHFDPRTLELIQQAQADDVFLHRRQPSGGRATWVPGGAAHTGWVPGSWVHGSPVAPQNRRRVGGVEAQSHRPVTDDPPRPPEREALPLIEQRPGITIEDPGASTRLPKKRPS
jgi:hypothetical protein